MAFDVERFIALTATMAVSVACARQSAPASSPPTADEAAVVQVPSAEESEPESRDELVAVVEDDGRDPRGDEDEVVDAAVEGAPFEESGMVGALTGGPMLEGGLGLRAIGSGGGGTGFGSGSGTIGLGSSGAAKPLPKVQLGSNAVKGSLAPSIIQRVMRVKLSRIRACYQKELLQGSFNAKLVVNFVIGGNGRVTSVLLRQSSGRAKLDACVQQVFQSMVFPTPKGGGVVSVSYPVILSAR
jgi:TonB family protein